jgi:hypothetical protein
MSHVGTEMSDRAGVVCPITADGLAFFLPRLVRFKLREGPVELAIVEQRLPSPVVSVNKAFVFEHTPILNFLCSVIILVCLAHKELIA